MKGLVGWLIFFIIILLILGLMAVSIIATEDGLTINLNWTDVLKQIPLLMFKR